MRNDKRILAENVVYTTDCSKTGLNNNVIVCGTSGCGKTMSVSEPLLLETYQTNLVVTVTKRRLVKKYAPMFVSRGYSVLDLNFVNPEESNISYDPLKYINDFSDMTYLAKAIVLADGKRENSVADPYWEQCAISLLTAEIALSLTKCADATFADVLELHDSLKIEEIGGEVSTTLDKLFKAYQHTKGGEFAMSCWRCFRDVPYKTANCIYSTLNATIATIFSPALRKMMKLNKKLDFEKFASQKTVLFVSTSAVNPALNSFINMFYSHVFKQLFEIAEKRPDGKLPIPVHVLCDDFATGGRILNFPEYISIFREKQISVTLLIQSESQLEGMYGYSNAITIINNCDTYLYMGGMDLKTGRSVSERINLPLEDVLYMPVGHMFVFRRGQKPIKTLRYNILKNPTYIKVTAQYERSINKQKIYTIKKAS